MKSLSALILGTSLIMICACSSGGGGGGGGSNNSDGESQASASNDTVQAQSTTDIEIASTNTSTTNTPDLSQILQYTGIWIESPGITEENRTAYIYEITGDGTVNYYSYADLRPQDNFSGGHYDEECSHFRTGKMDGNRAYMVYNFEATNPDNSYHYFTKEGSNLVILSGLSTSYESTNEYSRLTELPFYCELSRILKRNCSSYYNTCHISEIDPSDL